MHLSEIRINLTGPQAGPVAGSGPWLPVQHSRDDLARVVDERTVLVRAEVGREPPRSRSRDGTHT